MNILSVGNSFGIDTMHHLGEIAKSAGIINFTFANLYIGGCSVKRHYNNAINNTTEYVYHVNKGEGWTEIPGQSILDGLNAEKWDIISIQHGTGDNSRYTATESYEMLVPLIKYIRSHLSYDVKIAFNMAWVMDPESTHPEMVSYGGNQKLMYENLTKITSSVVAPNVDIVSPTGTAIQNMRQYYDKKLTRDNFHLSFDLGRYIASMTFLYALCQISPSSVTWAPETVTESEQILAKKAAESAVITPYSTSSLL